MKTAIKLILLLFFVSKVDAQEAILDFHSLIDVQQDGRLIVTETIKVRAEGKKIRRGIFREFPLDYKDQLGNRYRVQFNLLETRRDGTLSLIHI